MDLERFLKIMDLEYRIGKNEKKIRELKTLNRRLNAAFDLIDKELLEIEGGEDGQKKG